MSTSDDNAVANAWQIHAAVSDWTGKVDAKASFALGLETAVFGALVALRQDGWQLAELNNTASQIGHAAAGVFLALAMLLAAGVIVPILRGRSLAAEHSRYYVYFGHLRQWKAQDLVAALRRDDILPVLSHQVINMSRIAWLKHRLVQLSMISATIGSIALGFALITN